MLDECNKFLSQIKNETRLKELKRQKRTYYYTQFKKWLVRILFAFLFVTVVFFPVETGTVIGTWISEFFGTIIKSSTK